MKKLTNREQGQNKNGLMKFIFGPDEEVFTVYKNFVTYRSPVLEDEFSWFFREG